MSNRFSIGGLVMIALLMLTGCAAPSAPLMVTAGPEQPAQPSTPAELTPVTLGLGYVPSVQFAPFYVAQNKGFFTEQGLAVEMQHGIETDFLKLVGVNQMQFAVGSGDQVILGRAQGLPLTYTLAWYRQFPVVVMSLADRGLDTPQALEGQRVGIPGMFGASLVAWKALVYAAGLDESKVMLESIGFTQPAAVSQGRVDAALDYVANGPVQLRLAGQEVNIIQVSDFIDLPSNGLITNAQTVSEHPELVQGMTNAVLAGIRYTLANPDEAFALSLQAVPEAGGDNEAASRAVFDASLALWQAADDEIGLSDPAAWQKAAQFMRAMGLIEVDVPADAIFTNQFVDAATE
ncbi:MAG: ABC transporter substrate-binding protein [Anaerolineae bacterium]